MPEGKLTMGELPASGLELNNNKKGFFPREISGFLSTGVEY